MLESFQTPVTHAEFGALVGVSRQAIGELTAMGVLPQGGTCLDWLHAYCGRLREQAAGRLSRGSLDLAQERAALAKEQREGQALKNQIARGEYAAVALLEEVLAIASGSVADRLDGLDGLLRRVAPDLPEAARDALTKTIADARSEWVRATQRLVVERLDEDDSGDELVEMEGDRG